MNYKWLENAAIEQPENIALKFQDESLNYRQLYMKAHELATHLQALKVKRVGLYIDNSLDASILIHALMLSGTEMVMLNTRLTVHELKLQLEEVSVSTVLSTIHLDIPEFKVLSFEEIYELPAETFMLNDPAANDILSIMFTSGTTGRAKAVGQTYGNHYASHINCQKFLNYKEDSVWMMVNPIFHISGLSILFRSVISMSTMVIMNKFKTDLAWQTLEHEKVTHTSMVPVMLNRLVKEEGTHFLQALLMGGANTTPKLLQKAKDKGLPVYNSFGMTETCSQIVQLSYDDPKIFSGAVGNIHDTMTEITIDETTDEMLLRGDSVVQSYLNADIELKGGFFNTGDIIQIDEDGYIYVLDRRNDLIISGGENIYPKEIEDVVYQLDGVNRCVVIKKEDDEWGYVPILLLEDDIDQTTLLNHLYKHLAKYKIPREIYVIDEIKTTSTGKISRTINRNMFLNL